MKLARKSALAACILLFGCASQEPLTPYEALAVKRALIAEHHQELTASQIQVFMKASVRTEADAEGLIARFLETNQRRSILDTLLLQEDRDPGATASTPGTDVIATPAD